MQVYHGKIGQHISDAAVKACNLASMLGEVVALDFNETQVKVGPGQSPDSVVEDWRRMMNAAAEAYHASPAGKQAKIEADNRLARLQVKHDEAMAVLPTVFADARLAVIWLTQFSESADHIGIQGRNFGRVADVLEASGWRQNDACHLPKHEYEHPRIFGLYIIGQAIDMLRNGLPPHQMLMDKMGKDFLAMPADY